MRSKLFLFLLFVTFIAFTNCDMTGLSEQVDYVQNGDGRFPKFTLFMVSTNSINYSCIIDGQENVVACELPYGVPRDDLTVSFDITEKGQMFISNKRQYSGTSAYNFTNPVEVMLKDWGGEESYYTITVKNTPPNGLIPKIIAYTILLNGLEYKCFIDEEKKTITGSVPYGTDRSALVASFQTTENPNVVIDGIPQLSGITANDFTVSRKLKLKDYEDEVNEYAITIAIAPNSEALIYSFSLTIDNTEYVSQVKSDTIITYVPYGTELSSAKVYSVLSDYAQMQLQDVVITNGDAVNVSTDQIIRVIAQNQETTKDYMLIVKYLPNTAASFSSFMLLSGSTYYNCTITDTNITVNVPYGTDVQHMVARFYASYGAQVSVNGAEQTSSQTVNDFSSAVVYSVVSENGQYTQNYTVNVTVLPNHEAKIIEYYAHAGSGSYKGTIEASTITVNMPAEINLDSITDSYTLSPGAHLAVSGSQLRADDTNNFVIKRFYRVTSADNSEERDYIINIIVLKNNKTTVTDFNLWFSGASLGCTQVDYVISCTSPYKANVTSGVATFTLPYGAHAYINGIEQVNGSTVNNFSGPVIYTVIAENGATASYTVNTRLGCKYEMPGGNTYAVTNASPTSIDGIPINYGIGKFNSLSKQLTDSCGYEILYPNYPYEYNINSLIDPYIDGALPIYGAPGGQSIRLKANGVNVRSLGLDVVTKDLSSLQVPPANQVYVDPINSRFAMPGPLLSLVYKPVASTPAIIAPRGGYDFHYSGDDDINVHYFKNQLFKLAVKPNMGDPVFFNRLYPLPGSAWNLRKGTALFKGTYNYPYLISGAVSFVFSLYHGTQKHTVTQKVFCDFSIGCHATVVAQRDAYPSCEMGVCNDIIYSFSPLARNRFFLYMAWDFESGFGEGTAMKLYAVYGNHTVSLLGTVPYAGENITDFNAANITLDIYVQNKESSSPNDNIENWIYGEVEYFKLWDSVVSDTADWLGTIGTSAMKDIVHPVYGFGNNYSPGAIETSYFYND